jgi:hypothetical protein
MQRKNFRTVGDDIYLADLSGHAVYITAEFSPVPDILWSLAYGAGAISEDMTSPDVSDYNDSKKKEQEAIDADNRLVIKNKMREAFENPLTYLDKNDNVIHRKIIGLVNQPIKKDLVDAIWSELSAEI